MLQTVSADRWRSLEAGAERGGAALSGGAGGDRGRRRGHPGGGEVPGDRRRLGTLSNRSVMLRTSGRRAGSVSSPPPSRPRCPCAARGLLRLAGTGLVVVCARGCGPRLVHALG